MRGPPPSLNGHAAAPDRGPTHTDHPRHPPPPKRVCAQGSYWYAATHMGSTTIGRMLTRRRRSHRRLFRHRLLHPLQTPPPPTSSPPHLLFAAASGPEVPTAHFVCIRGGSAAESRCEPHSRVASLLYGNCHSRLANVIASTILSLVRLACRSCSRVCSSSRLVVASKPWRSVNLSAGQGGTGQTVSGITAPRAGAASAGCKSRNIRRRWAKTRRSACCAASSGRPDGRAGRASERVQSEKKYE